MKHVIRQKLVKVADSAKIIDFLSLSHHEVCCFIDNCGFITLQRHPMRKNSIITDIRYLCGGKLSTKLYDKPDDCDVHIVNFPFLSSNIPSSPSYGVHFAAHKIYNMLLTLLLT